MALWPVAPGLPAEGSVVPKPKASFSCPTSDFTRIDTERGSDGPPFKTVKRVTSSNQMALSKGPLRKLDVDDVDKVGSPIVN
jgi:hypothetical protein